MREKRLNFTKLQARGLDFLADLELSQKGPSKPLELIVELERIQGTNTLMESELKAVAEANKPDERLLWVEDI